jgi:hypothetical protein
MNDLRTVPADDIRSVARPAPGPQHLEVMTGQDCTPPERRSVPWEHAFLAALRRTGNVSKSAQLAGTTRRNAYYRRASRPEFAAAWDDAYETFVDELEEEAHRRAFQGVARYRFTPAGQPILDPVECRCQHPVKLHERYEGRCSVDGCDCEAFHGVPYFELIYSDPLLQTLLKGHRPTKYRDRLNISDEELDAAIEIEKLRQAAVAAVGASGNAGAAAAGERGGAGERTG